MARTIPSDLYLIASSVTLSDRWLTFKKCLPPKVNLLAVSKGHPASSIRVLAELGQIDFGESRFQEALPKIEQLQDIEGIRWHFIGRLQSNKVRAVLRHFDVIHSVDSFSLAERISRIAGEEMCSPEILFQVKFREDYAKSGFTKTELSRDWTRLINLPNIKIAGLMAICPLGLNSIGREKIFADCRNLANELGLNECSMGMSSDWEEALRQGSTWLRLGSELFGSRPGNVNFSRDITKNE